MDYMVLWTPTPPMKKPMLGDSSYFQRIVNSRSLAFENLYSHVIMVLTEKLKLKLKN